MIHSGCSQLAFSLCFFVVVPGCSQLVAKLFAAYHGLSF